MVILGALAAIIACVVLLAGGAVFLGIIDLRHVDTASSVRHWDTTSEIVAAEGLKRVVVYAQESNVEIKPRGASEPNVVCWIKRSGLLSGWCKASQERRGDTLYITYDSRVANDFFHHFLAGVVEVPPGMRVELKATASSCKVTNLVGDLDCTTDGASYHLDVEGGRGATTKRTDSMTTLKDRAGGPIEADVEGGNMWWTYRSPPPPTRLTVKQDGALTMVVPRGLAMHLLVDCPANGMTCIDPGEVLEDCTKAKLPLHGSITMAGGRLHGDLRGDKPGAKVQVSVQAGNLVLSRE